MRIPYLSLRSILVCSRSYIVPPRQSMIASRTCVVFVLVRPFDLDLLYSLEVVAIRIFCIAYSTCIFAEDRQDNMNHNKVVASSN